MLVKVEFCTFAAPHTPTTWCSIQTLSMVMFDWLRRSQVWPGPSMRES